MWRSALISTPTLLGLLTVAACAERGPEAWPDDAGGPAVLNGADAALGDAGALDDADGGTDPGGGPGSGDGGIQPGRPPAVAVPACDDALDLPVGQVPSTPAPAGAAFTGNPGNPGEMGAAAVLQVDFSLPNPDPARPALTGTFYAPSDDGGFTARPGPLPLVLVMHGFGTTHRNYDHFSTHLASHGLLALGLSLPAAAVAAHDKNADEAVAAISFALGADAPAQVAGLADPARIAAAGHSFGGKIAFYAAAQDTRISLVIGWDPSNAGGPPCFVDPAACNDFPVAPNCQAMDAGLVHRIRAESLIFRAAPDGANPEPDHNAIHFYRGAPTPSTLVDYDTAVMHGDWANGLLPVVAHSRAVHVALLLQRLTGATGLDAWLPGGAEVAAGLGVKRVLRKQP